MGLSSPGIGSGLDIKGMVDAMVKADIAHLQARHDKKLNSVNAEISAVGQLKSTLASLQNTMNILSNTSQFYKIKSTLSDAKYFDATVTDKALPGLYQIKVQALAQSQSLSTTYFANSNTALGEGNITINFGTYSSDLATFTANTNTSPVSITIENNNNSLEAICNAINAASSELSASIVQDSLGARLSISSTSTGENYAMQITSDIAALNYHSATGQTTLTQNLAAQNSIVQINGITINQNSNQLKDVLGGITLNLKEISTDTSVSLRIEKNQENLTTCINEFIKKYNECMTFLNNATGYDQETQKGGFFQGDAQVKNLKLGLYQAVTNFIAPSSSSIRSLSDLGITTLKGGTLQLDQDKLDTAIKENYNEIATLFAKSITATDPNIQVNSLNAKIAAGSYEVTLNEYTPGVSLSGTIGNQAAISTDGLELKGTGQLSALSINILGGSVGTRGQIDVTDGLAVLLSDVIDNYMGHNGLLDKRNDSLNHDLRQLTKTQEQIDDKSEVLEKKYLTRWNAVDLLISRLQDTSGMLSQMLSNLPKLKIKD